MSEQKYRFEMSRGFPAIQPNLDTNRPGFVAASADIAG
jgi:hypothetical protein